MSDKKYLDEFMHDINEAEFTIDDRMKERIIIKTRKKINKRWIFLRRLAAACLIIAALSSFIPATPVYALRQKLFSFVPGVGVVENGEETGIIRSVLQKPVKVGEGTKFVEVKTAYLMGRTLHVSLITNAGAVDVGEFKDARQFKEFFAGETAPRLYLLIGKEKIKPSNTSWGGPSYETRAYSINADFYLNKENSEKPSFEIILDDFKPIIEIPMSPVKSGAAPESLGNAAVVSNIMIVADADRQDDVIRVLLSPVAPKAYRDIRFHLLDWEKKNFKADIHLVDREGNIYKPDDELQKQNNDSSNILYFHVPDKAKNLKLVIPQILYNRSNVASIRLNMPKLNKEVAIGKRIDMGETWLLVDKASLVPANDPLLPDDFKKFNSLKIDASASPKRNTREWVSRVIPNVEVPDGIFGFIRASSGSYADLWSADRQRGYSFTEFENMDKTKKIMLNLDVECVMNGPWEIQIP